MSAPRNETRTGIFVVATLAVLVGTLIYLGMPGAFQRQLTFYVYFDNAFGIKPGADVLVAGRKVGQVRRVFSPVPETERPEPSYESRVEVRVAADAGIYNRVRVQMVQLSMLGDLIIDFAEGQESSGMAPDRAHFLGTRQPGLSEAVPQVLQKLDPVLHQATGTLNSLQQAADNLTQMTSTKGQLQLALVEYRKVGENLNEITGSGGTLQRSLENIESLTSPGSPLARTFQNTEQVTASLAENKDIEAALRNLRHASEKMDRAMSELTPRISVIGQNLEEATDTLKHEPWRLVWPSSKTYPQEERRPAAARPAFDRAKRR